MVANKDVNEARLASTKHTFTNGTTNELRVTENDIPLVRAHAGAISFVTGIRTLRSFEVYHHISLTTSEILGARAQKHRPHLLTCPQRHRFKDRRHGNIDVLQSIANCCHSLEELLASKEDVATSHEEGCCNEILSCRNQRFTITRCNKVVVNTHQHGCLGAGLVSLRNVQIHFITIKISVIGGACTLIEAQRAALQNLDTVTHDGHFMERRLAVEKDNVIVIKVAFDHITNSKFPGQSIAVTDICQVLLCSLVIVHERSCVARCRHESRTSPISIIFKHTNTVSTRVNLWTIANGST
mmetsp:Transcript_21743/g.42753  ORF Transcript_21743/g.42753 Transcript_21743/m.42753 type:complete len:298 (+) Transcript_21743:2467-3360(+)